MRAGRLAFLETFDVVLVPSSTAIADLFNLALSISDRVEVSRILRYPNEPHLHSSSRSPKTVASYSSPQLSHVLNRRGGRDTAGRSNDPMT